MPQICYTKKRLSRSSLDLIDQANEIITEYTEAGFRLTLRQLYYQFVARDLLANRQQNYKRLGVIMSDARNAGLVDWDAIEDRTRNLQDNNHWDSPADILAACAEQFRYDVWATQTYRPEVWIEKDALLGVFEPTCTELDVPLFSCRGYTSQSEIWVAGRRLLRHLGCKQTPLILHFGDHDPSGLDMTRDILGRLGLYSEHPVDVNRLALNMDQIEKYRPPPNPAKITDSRYVAYCAIHGSDSWELDALDPRVLSDLARTAIEAIQDKKAWKKMLAAQALARLKLRKLGDQWDE